MSFKNALKNMADFFSHGKIEDCGDCMSELEIARLIEDKVNKRERQRFLNHLSQCTDCYHLWSETAAFNALLETEQSAGQQSAANKQPFFDFSFFSPKIGIPAMGALATVCLLVILWRGDHGFQNEIDTAYQQLVLQDHTQVKVLAEELSEYIQPDAMAFSKAQTQPQQKAFAAGLWEGRNAMAPENSSPLPMTLLPSADASWSDSQWKLYYQLGKWAALAWVASQASDANVDWTKLQQALTDIHDALANVKPELSASIEINLIKPYLDKLNQNNNKNTKELAGGLTKMISKLTPD